MIERRTVDTLRELRAAYNAIYTRSEYGESEALYRQVLDLLEPPAGVWVLDVGCGTGQFLAYSAAQGLRPLGVDIAAGSYIFPVIDCEVALDPEISYSTARGARLKLEVREISGNSQLPALKSDTPTGASTFDGLPIFNFEPDWAKGIKKGRSRQGKLVPLGLVMVNACAFADQADDNLGF